MKFQKIQIRKKMNWIQIYWDQNPKDYREYQKMLALGWAKYPEDTRDPSKLFQRIYSRGFIGWTIQFFRIRIGYQKGTWFYVEER